MVPLNHRITIERPSTVKDAIGQPVEGWEPVDSGDGKIWANVRYLNGVETIKAGAEMSIAKASIRVRYRTDLDASMRVRYGATTFKVNAVLPDEVGRWHVDLVCEVIK